MTVKTFAINIKSVEFECICNVSKVQPAIINADPYDCREAEGGLEEVLEASVKGVDVWHLLSTDTQDQIWEAIQGEIR